MDNEELADLVSAVEELREKVEESIHRSKVTNVLLLAMAQRVDVTRPMEARKIMRYLSVTDRAVRNYSDE